MYWFEPVSIDTKIIRWIILVCYVILFVYWFERIAHLLSSARTGFGRVSKQWSALSQSTAETERSRKTGMEGARWTEFTVNFEVCDLQGLQPTCEQLQFPRSSRQYNRTKKNRPLTHGGQRTKNKIITQILSNKAKNIKEPITCRNVFFSKSKRFISFHFCCILWNAVGTIF